MSDTEDDPLKRVVVDKDAVNRERLADAIEGVVAIDGDTGEVVTRLGYHDLDNKPKFVARLLARRAALELEIIDEDELGDTSSGFAERIDASKSGIQNYGGLDFVANDDDHGGYYIKGHSIGLAIDFLKNAKGDDDE